MKLHVLLLTLIIVTFNHSYAQIWELSSNKFTDMATHQAQSEHADIIIDSNRITITTGPTNFYYDITQQKIDDNRNYAYKMLDKNDDTVLAVFSPRGKIFDYHVDKFYLRYSLDKVTKVVPPLSDSAKAKIKADSIKKVLADTSETEPKEDTTVYDDADVMPEYPGGHGEMMNFLAKNIHYPKSAKEQNIHGFLTAEAIVEKDGSIKRVSIVNDIGGGCGPEAIRVIKMMPKWTPAERKGETVRAKVTIPVSFMPAMK